MASDLHITENTKVSLNFSITLDTGEVVDSNFDREPASFVMGDGSLLPGFEACLVGMKGGEEGVFTITPEQGFGEPQEANYQDIPVIPSVTTLNLRLAWCFRLLTPQVVNFRASLTLSTRTQSVLTSITHSRDAPSGLR